MASSIERIRKLEGLLIPESYQLWQLRPYEFIEMLFKDIDNFKVEKL